MSQRRILLWQASLPWAVVEMGLFGGLLIFGTLWQYERLAPGTVGQALLFLVSLAALWYALRLRVGSGSGWRQLFREIVAVCAFVLVVMSWPILVYAVGWGGLLGDSVSDYLTTLLVLLFGIFECVVFRVGVWLWVLWQHLRRRHLLWELAHMQVQFALLLALVPAAFLTLALLGTREFLGLDLIVRTLFPVLGIVSAMLFVTLVVVLPPAVVLAYFSARRTTRRLNDLARATAALREGDYDVRVQPQGEDEVAQLQDDFNAMADDLAQAMADLQAQRNRVEAVLRSRRDLVASVSHELRTPVATIRGYLEPALANWETTSLETLRHDLEVMGGEVVRLQGLIDDLFTLARADVGGLPLDVGPLDIGTVVRRQVDAIEPLAWASSQVTVVAQVMPSLPSALADEARLEQVLVNLLRNAVRHTPPGGIVAVVAAAEDEHVRIEVRDTGEGIPSEELPHIWERFYRGQGAREQRGTGLGLALVKELVEAMGGTVGVESEVGQGSCFTVWVPRYKDR